jgi:hypothetical protein
MSHQLLQLVKHIVVHLLILMLHQILSLPVISTEQVVSEGRDVEELLEHRVHVANAPQIPQSHEVLVAVGP